MLLPQVFIGKRAMNCAARVNLIEHLTTEQSDTRITQLLRFGVSRSVLAAEDADLVSTFNFAVSVLEAKYSQYVLQASEHDNIHYVCTGNKRVNYCSMFSFG
jgi:hypothetical protein